MMSGSRRDLMELNGDFGPIEDMRAMQGETIPPVQSDFGGFDSGEPVFLQAEEEISVRRSIQAMRGHVAPII